MNSIKIAVSQGMLRLPTEHGFALSSLRYGGRGPTEPRVKTLSEYSFPFAGKPARRLVLPAASWRLSSAPPCRYSVRVVDPLTNIDASRPSAGCAVPFGCRTYGAREPALFSLSALSCRLMNGGLWGPPTPGKGRIKTRRYFSHSKRWRDTR